MRKRVGNEEKMWDREEEIVGKEVKMWDREEEIVGKELKMWDREVERRWTESMFVVEGREKRVRK